MVGGGREREGGAELFILKAPEIYRLWPAP